jgi:hypothetical protein
MARMDLFWFLLTVLAIVLVLFVILPNIWEKQPPATVQAVQPRRPVPAVHPPPRHDAQEAALMLAQHYVPAKDAVPVNYPRKAIGDCPFSKPQSTALPAVDVPLCMLKQRI